MATVVFDFDSTLIDCESLEEILAPKCAARPELDAQIRAITTQGMEGLLSFQDSLSRRLALASPTREEVCAFGERALVHLTPGIAALVAELRAQSVEIKIISGGLREAILPVALHLGLTAADVGAVSLSFAEDGRFLGIDPHDRYSHSKQLGAAEASKTWSRPRIGVGDGMTDFHLFQHGLVDHFIAYTQWARRQAVVATGSAEASQVETLKTMIQELL